MQRKKREREREGANKRRDGGDGRRRIGAGEKKMKIRPALTTAIHIVRFRCSGTIPNTGGGS